MTPNTTLAQYEQLTPHVCAHDLVWLTPNQHCAWRVDTLMTKEPDTVSWIATMREDNVLYDVGANMGQYSLLAAKRGVRVHAFEPESQNFALLCRNVAVNKLAERITPWPMALAARTGPDLFYVTQLIAGGSCNSFGQSVDYHLREKQFATKQGAFGITGDEFAEYFGPPSHIKIDVDGFEHAVLAGMHHLLPTVTSVLVETNTHLPAHGKIAPLLAEFGLLPDTALADVSRRRDGPFEGIGNVIYTRARAAK